jgi:hypothetical protein
MGEKPEKSKMPAKIDGTTKKALKILLILKDFF